MGCLWDKDIEEKKHKVYFIKEGRNYKFPCSKEEYLKNVVIRFCQEYEMNKELYYFIHNNNYLNENLTYDKLVTNQDNKRIISIIRRPNSSIWNQKSNCFRDKRTKISKHGKHNIKSKLSIYNKTKL